MYKDQFKNEVLPRSDQLYAEIAQNFKHEITAAAVFTSINKNYHQLRQALGIPLDFSRMPQKRKIVPETIAEDSPYEISDDEDDPQSATPCNQRVYESAFTKTEWGEIDVLARSDGKRTRRKPGKGWTHVVHHKVFSLVPTECAFKYVFKNLKTLARGTCTECSSEVFVDLLDQPGEEKSYQRISVRFNPGQLAQKHLKKRFMSGKLKCSY